MLAADFCGRAGADAAPHGRECDCVRAEVRAASEEISSDANSAALGRVR